MEGGRPAAHLRLGRWESESPPPYPRRPAINPSRRSESSILVVNPSRQSESSIRVISPSHRSESSIRVIDPSLGWAYPVTPDSGERPRRRRRSRGGLGRRSASRPPAARPAAVKCGQIGWSNMERQSKERIGKRERDREQERASAREREISRTK